MVNIIVAQDELTHLNLIFVSVMNASTRILLVLFVSYAIAFMLVAGSVPFDRAIGEFS